MKAYRVTYMLGNQQWTEELTEGQLKNLEARLESGAEEQIVSVQPLLKDTYWQSIQKGKCPECGGLLVFEGGCTTCYTCGWSACS